MPSKTECPFRVEGRLHVGGRKGVSVECFGGLSQHGGGSHTQKANLATLWITLWKTTPNPLFKREVYQSKIHEIFLKQKRSFKINKLHW
jgi:hypothetical protein